MKRFTYQFLALLILSAVTVIVSCKSKQDQQYTPWGTPINADGTIPHGDSLHTQFSLDDIIAHGEMIMLTMTGPDTYYDYHGRGMGKEYLLCESFASQIGVKLRVEVCRDTTEMVDKLQKGEGDIIVPTGISRDVSASNSSGVSNDGGNAGGLVDLASFVHLKMGWYVSKKNETLADSLNRWYKPEMLTKIQNKMTALLANGGVTRHVYSPMLNSAKGVISDYDGYFQKYASMAGLDWRLIAAQCYQESCFDPKAHSWAGACGLMQIMPATGAYLGLSQENLFSPEENIAAGVKFMRQLVDAFGNIGDPADRMAYALASYNGGPQHIYDAMALAKKYGGTGQHWSEVKEYVLKLMQPQYYKDPVVKRGYMRGTETVAYVDRILNRWAQYRGCATSVSYSGGSSSSGIGLSRGNATPHPIRHR